MLTVSRMAAEKARSKAMVQAEAKAQVKDEVSRILSAERSMAQEGLQQSVLRERLAAEDERRRAELFVSLSTKRHYCMDTTINSTVTHYLAL